MNVAKDVLERLEAMKNAGKMSGESILSELQELIDKAPAAVQEIYQAEQDIEDANTLLSAYERAEAESGKACYSCGRPDLYCICP